MYLEGNSVKNEIKCRVKRVVYQGIVQSDKIKGNLEEKEIMSNNQLESNSDPQGNGTADKDDFLIKEVELIMDVSIEGGKLQNYKRPYIPLTMIDMVDKIFFAVGALVNVMRTLEPIQKDKD